MGFRDSFCRTASCRLVFTTCIVSAMYTANNLLSYFCVAQMDPGTLAIAKSLASRGADLVLFIRSRHQETIAELKALPGASKSTITAMPQTRWARTCPR